MGTSAPFAVDGNNPLSGLMATCSFDHIHHPETDGGRYFPLHGIMMSTGKKRDDLTVARERRRSFPPPSYIEHSCEISDLTVCSAAESGRNGTVPASLHVLQEPKAMKRVLTTGLLFYVLLAATGQAADLASVPAVTEHGFEQSSGIFDEARFGTLVSIEDEHGTFATGLVLFDPWGHEQAQGLGKLIRPRVHIGASLSTAGEANQVYAGFSWTANVTDRFFLELGFGGTLHDGDLDESDGGDSPKLGCRALFHEYAAAGYNLTERWSIITQIEHSSHAELCNGSNNGLSRAGILVSYKF